MRSRTTKKLSKLKRNRKKMTRNRSVSLQPPLRQTMSKWMPRGRTSIRTCPRRKTRPRRNYSNSSRANLIAFSHLDKPASQKYKSKKLRNKFKYQRKSLACPKLLNLLVIIMLSQNLSTLKI